MAIPTYNVTLSTMATLVASAPAQTDITIFSENSSTVYYGGSNVTVANGFGVIASNPGTPFTLTLHPGESLYAVLLSGTATLSVLAQTLTEPSLTVLNGALPVAA